MVVLRMIHQSVGLVRVAGGAPQIVAVPALGNILPRDGLDAVQHRGPEQAGAQHFVLVDVDLQWVHLPFLILQQT